MSDFAGAIEAFNQAIEIDESLGLAYSGLSQVYQQQGLNYAEILPLAQKGIELSPDSSFAHAILAQAFLFQHQSEQALESARKAAELDAEDAYVQAVLVHSLIQNSDFEAAKEAAEKAYALDPESAEALGALAAYNFSTADFKRARTALEQAVSLEPDSLRWKILLGDYWLRREQFAKAAEIYQAALDSSPDFLPAILGMANLATWRQDFELAQDWLEKAGSLAPEEPDVSLTWALSYLMQEEYEEAIEKLDETLEIYPDHYRANVYLGSTYLAQNDCDRSERKFLDLEEKYPQDIEVIEWQGYAKYCLGNVIKGLTYFRMAQEKNPYDSHAPLGLGFGLMYEERWDESQDALVEALKLAPDVSLAYSRLGALYMAQGMIEQAEVEMRLAIRLNPYASDYYASLADVLVSQERYTEALDLVNTFQEYDDTDIEVTRAFGITNYFLGNNAEALDAFQQVLEKDPEYVLMHLYLGLVQRNLGYYKKAGEEIRTYRALAESSLTEEASGLIAYLEASLSESYHLTEEHAIELFEQFMQSFLAGQYEASFQDLEGGRTMVIEVPTTQVDFENEELLSSVAGVMYISSLVAPRVDPPVSNGVLARIEERGKLAFSIAAPLSLSQRYLDTLIDSRQLFEKWEFSLEETSLASYSTADVQRNASQIRELDSTQEVPFETITPQELQAQVTESIDAEAHESLLHDEALLEMLGVIPADTNLEQTLVDVESEQIAGYYDPDAETFYLVDQGEMGAFDQIVIAHEYVHALQDQNFGLDDLDDPEKNDDQQFAYRAFIEGDATLSGVLFMEEHVPVINLLQIAAQASEQTYEQLESAPDFIKDSMAIPYTSGMEFVQWLYDIDGWASVNAAYDKLPQSTEQILHPQRYLDGDQPVDVTLPDIAASLAEAWTEVDNNVLGELNLRLFVDEHLGPAAGIQAAEGWGGDRYILLANNATGEYILMMRTVWDDQDEADEFWALFRRVMEYRAGFEENVEALVGDLDARWWVSEEFGTVYARVQERHVYIIMGPNRELIEQIIAQLP